MRKFLSLLGASLAALTTCHVLATPPDAAIAANEGMLHAGDGAVLDGSGKPVLLRCLNLSAWLIPEGYLVGEGSFAALTTSPSQIRQRLAALVGPDSSRAFWRDWSDVFVEQADFSHFRQAGFNCVRLPVNYKYITSRAADGEVAFDELGIAPVDRAVAWGKANGIYVFLDLHDAPGGQNALATVSDVSSSDRVARLWEGPTAAENQNMTVALWHALAARYATASSIGGYDLLNEPNLPAAMPPAELAKLYERMIAAIRTIDASHLIVLEGNGYARDFAALRAVPDGNVMLEFHEYSLFNPTWRTPTQAALAPFLALRAATHKPLWLGEFGEASAQWQAGIVRLMMANGIGWAIWPWKRIDLKNGHPVIETINTPPAWNAMAGYLVGQLFARRPSPDAAQQAMAQMLKAVRTTNCRHDLALERALAGQ